MFRSFCWKQLSNGSLIFSSIRHTRSEWPDEGYFQCLATVPSVGTLLSRKAKLQVASLLRFDEEPSDKDVLLGEKALFVCSIQATPSPTILWLKNGQPLTLDASRMLLLPSGSLEIDGVTKSDEGRYQCNATNIANSRLSREAALQVITDPDLLNAPRQPEFISKPKSTVAIEGQNVTLDCVANGSPAPWITWLKDGTSLDMANLDSRFVKLGSGSLLIIHVQEADSGTYQCRAYNKEDSIDASALLDVQVAPRFEKKPTSQIAKEKQDIELECEVYGRPEPTVEWYKNGELIIESDYFQMVNGKHLKILGLVSSDAGIYQCMAFNAAGYIQASAHLSVLPASGSSPSHEEVEISDLPDLDLQTHLHLGDDWGVQGLPSDPRNVSSVIVSKRFVTLRWQPPLHSEGPVLTYSVFYHQDSSNRERIVNTSKEETIIQGLQPGKAYTFQVVAHGPQGPGIPSKPIVIMTQGEDSIPTGPRNLRAFPVSNSAIQVQWDAPSNDHGTLPLPLTYNVYYMQEGSSEESHIATQGTSYVIHNLHPYTEYSIWVAPEGGRSTEDVSARTHSDIPSDTPQNVTVEAASSTSIVVHWEPPPPEHQNGVITGYKIRYKERGRRGETITTDGNRRLYAITNLEKGQEYSLRISALTVNGSGPWTDWIDVETYPMDLDESVVPDAPGSIRARPMKTSITVMWTPPKNQSIIVRGYTIGYGIGVPDVYKKLVDGKQRYYAIEGLEPNAEYVISLRAYNGMGDGRPIYEHVRTRGDDDTESASPITPPLGVKAIVHSENTVVLYWTDSTLPSDQVTDNRYYTIRYTSHPQSPRYKFRNTTELNYMIDDLKPYTRYEFSVKVTKGLRESQWSLVAVNTTDEAAPESPPRDLTIVPSDNNPDMVYVNWQPPKIPNGIITGYVIYYTTNLSQPDWNWLVDGVVGDRLTTTVRGLKPGLSYYFKIQARNSKGNSPPSPTAIYHTPSFSHGSFLLLPARPD
ncbi:unnamed protein product [Darwinula stevensoni]|uniref:Uncharacterized protein n=1 Tax=Darwinula stevensoni TaxID=69355 RepID=A0A7R8XE07_9CRUS|nr:unnamed protein product [Darwinula stevensoni]CAG0894859.1 unnamed protein product [Darwinula stevensoni]